MVYLVRQSLIHRHKLILWPSLMNSKKKKQKKNSDLLCILFQDIPTSLKILNIIPIIQCSIVYYSKTYWHKTAIDSVVRISDRAQQ